MTKCPDSLVHLGPNFWPKRLNILLQMPKISPHFCNMVPGSVFQTTACKKCHLCNHTARNSWLLDIKDNFARDDYIGYSIECKLGVFEHYSYKSQHAAISSSLIISQQIHW